MLTIIEDLDLFQNFANVENYNETLSNNGSDYAFEEEETWTTITTTTLLPTLNSSLYSTSKKSNHQLFINIILIVLFVLLSALSFIISAGHNAAAAGVRNRRNDQTRTRARAARGRTGVVRCSDINELTNEIVDLMTLHNSLRQIEQIGESRRPREEQLAEEATEQPPPEYNSIISDSRNRNFSQLNLV